MKFLKLFAFVSIFVVSFLIITPNTASAEEGSCKVASWVYGTGDDQNGPCVARDFDECEADPYFHLSKVMTCEWDPGTPPSNPPYPEVSILATPHEIVSGGTSKIQWEAVNVVSNSCILNGSTVSTTGSQNVTLTSTTSYVLVCVASSGGYHVTDNTLVTVTPQPLNVYFIKNPNNIKNLVDYDNGDPIGTVGFSVYITGLNGTGRTCEYYENNQPINPQKKWTVDVYNEIFSRSNLKTSTVNSMILCRNAEGGTIYSSHLGTNTQSAVVNGANNTCTIAPNTSNCTVPINWTTTSPYPGQSSFLPVATYLTINGAEIDSGNIGNNITISDAGLIGGPGVKTINFNNKVDHEGNTATTILAPVTNVMKTQEVNVICQSGAGWTAPWNGTVCYNAPIIVNAGVDQNISGTSVSLTGSTSDADGPAITSYSWTMTSGPNSPSFTTPTALSTSATGLVSGTYIFKLKASNVIQNNSDEVTVNVNVTPTGYILTATNIGTGTGVVTSNPVGINCGSTCSKDFPKNQLVVLTATPTAANSFFKEWTGNCTGTSPTCNLTMDGAKNVTANFTLVTVNVIPTYYTYRANPSSNNSFAYAASTNKSGTLLECRLLDFMGEALPYSNYQIYSPDVPLVYMMPDFGGPYGYKIGCRNKTYINVVGKSDPNIIVTLNDMPQVDAGPDVGILLPTNSTTLTGSATDPDAPITTMWTKQSGPTGVVISRPDSLSTNITGLIAGTYIFKLEAKDGLNLVNSDTVTITVSNTQQYTLSITKNNSNGTGVVASAPIGINCGDDCSNTYSAGASVKLTAVATSTDSFFDGWSGNECSGTSPCTVSMTTNKTINAKFTRVNVSVIANPTSYTVNPGVNNLSITYTTSTNAPSTSVQCRLVDYKHDLLPGSDWQANSPINYTSPTVPGSYGYYVLCKNNSFPNITNESSLITVTVNASPIANAGPDASITGVTTTYTVSGASASDPDGSITGTPSWTFIPNPPSQTPIPTITFPGDPVNYYMPKFSGMTVNGSYAFLLTVTDNGGLTDTDEMTVVKGASGYTLSVTKNGTGTGTITSNPVGINCGTDCSEVYASGTSVTLTATPTATNSFFAGWGGDCSGTGTCSVNMGAPKNVTANFTLVTVNVSAETPYTTDPNTNVSFIYTATTNATPLSQCRLLDNEHSALTVYQATSPIVYLSPSVAGSYAYYIQCKSTTYPTITAISNEIIVNVTGVDVVPTVKSPTSSNVTTTTATLGANVTSKGIPAEIADRGICYGTSPTPPEIQGTCISAGLGLNGGLGLMSLGVTGLTPNTTYYYRGYAENATGVGYSVDGTFKTLVAPTGSIIATDCTIALGASTCVSTLNWTTSNLTSTMEVTRNNPDLTHISFDPIGVNVSDTVNYGSSTYFIYHLGDILAQDTISASCGVNTWNPATEVCEVGVPAGQPDLIANDPYLTTNIEDGKPVIVYSKIENIGKASTDPNASAPVSKVGFMNFIKKLFNINDASAGVSDGGGGVDGGDVTGTTGFINLFQVTTDPKDPRATVIDYRTTEMGHIAAGSYDIASSPEIIFTKGDWVRACADKSSAGDVSGVITNELDENNNCSGWVDPYNITVTPLGFINQIGFCEIQKNQDQCDGEISWGMDYPTGPVTEVTSDLPPSPVGTGHSGTATVYLPHSRLGGRYFYLYNDKIEYANMNFAAGCATGLEWDSVNSKCIPGNLSGDWVCSKMSECSPCNGGNTSGTQYCVAWICSTGEGSCLIPEPVPNPAETTACLCSGGGVNSIGLTATRYTIVKGSSSKITWGSSSTWATSCTAYGNWNPINPIDGGEEIVTPNSSQSYAINCIKSDGGESVPSSVDIKVIEPKIKER